MSFLEQLGDLAILRLAEESSLCVALAAGMIAFGIGYFRERRRSNRLSDEMVELAMEMVRELSADYKRQYSSLLKHAKAARRVGGTFNERARNLEKIEEEQNGD